jgi:hypothetical protein
MLTASEIVAVILGLGRLMSSRAKRTATMIEAQIASIDM